MSQFEELKSNIKSSYILKEILSLLNIERQLKIIIYNKQLQKELGIGIEDYKKKSGIYKIGKKNGRGSEYTLKTNKLIFRGEYLNGKRNGKGKEYYDNDKIMFRGEYLNGKRNGKGKEYYDNGKIKFEGEYLSGKRNGKGKDYYKKGVLQFEGEYLNEKKWNGKGFDNKGNIEFEIKNGKGNIKEYNENDKYIFIGVYLNGERNGKGSEYDKHYLIFKGEYLNGKKMEKEKNMIKIT